MNTKRYFNVGIIEIKPWSVVEEINAHKVGRGALYKIIKDLSHGLNFSYKIVPTLTSEEWGNRLANGSWTGWISTLMNGELDFSVTPTAYTVERYEDFHVTPVIHTSETVILAGGSAVVPKNLFGCFLAFDMEVWIAMLFSLLLIMLVSLLVDWLLDKVDNNDTDVQETLSYHFWNLLAAFFNEATDKSPRRRINKFLLGVWLLSMLILMNAFTGNFKSSLMLVKGAEKINSIEDLAKRKDVHVLLWKGGVFENLVRTSKQKAVQKIASRVFKTNGLISLSKLYADENLQKVQLGKTALITETSSAKSELGQRCSSNTVGSMYISREAIQPLHLTFLLSKNLPQSFRTALDRRVQQYTEGDLINKWLDEMYGDWKRCSVVETEQERTMGFKDLQAVFILWLLFLGFTLLVFIGETIVGRRQKRR